MKRTLKRTLSLLLAAVMVFGASPIGALALLTQAEDEGFQNGDIIVFGSYPQSEVTDSTLLSELNELSKIWISYGYYSGTGDYEDGQMTAKDYMKYADVTYNGNKYRAVTFSSHRPYCTGGNTSSSTYQDDNGYTTNTTYWFKYEPLKWRVLDSATGLILCDTIIDSQAYNNYCLYASGEYYGNSSKTYYANNYANSSIREWLNDDFYNTAFTSSEKSSIKTTTLDNNAYHEDYSEYDSASTDDKVFLLSFDEAWNSSYFEDRTFLQATGSDYAKCQGLEVYANKCSYWHLRSAGFYSLYTSSVCYYCAVDFNYETDCTDIGVRPALKINLSSVTDVVEYAPFEMEKYVADIWLDLHPSVKNTSESNWLDGLLSDNSYYGKISASIANELKGNTLFQNELANWNAFKFIFSPGTALEASTTVAPDKIYEMLMIDLIQNVLNNEGIQKSAASTVMSTAKSVKGVFDGLSSTDQVAYSIENIKKIYDEYNKNNYEVGKEYTWKYIAENLYEKDTSSNYKKFATLDKFSGIVGDILDVAKNADDFYKRYSAYVLTMSLTDSFIDAFKVIAENTTEKSLKNAINNFTRAENYKKISDAAIASLQIQTGILFVDGMKSVIDNLCSFIPYYGVLQEVYNVASFGVNLALNTQGIIDAYKLCECTAKMCDVTKSAIETLSNNYIKEKNKSNAAAYIAGVRIFIEASYVDLNSSITFAKATTEEGLLVKGANVVKGAWNKLWGKETETTYEQMCKNRDQIISLTNEQFTWINTDWIFNEELLEKDRPDIYPIYAQSELIKSVYTPSISDVYFDSNGNTKMEIIVPYQATRYAEKIRITETANDKTNYKNYSSNVSGTYSYINESTKTTLPRSYYSQLYISTDNGDVMSDKSNTRSLSRVEPATIDFSLFDGNLLVIKDDTTSKYDNIKYIIYRKIGENGEFRHYKTIDRDSSLFSINTSFEYDEVDGYQAYRIDSVMGFDDGTEIIVNSKNTLCFSENYGKVGNFLEKVENVIENLESRSVSAAGAVAKKITWTAIAGVDGYEIFRKSSCSNMYESVGTVTATEFTDATAESGKEYDYILVAYNIKENEFVYGVRSNVISVSYDEICICLADAELKVGDTLQLNAVSRPARFNVSWNSSDSSVISVSESGLITAVGIGTAVVTVISENGLCTDSKVFTVRENDDGNTTTISMEITKTVPESVNYKESFSINLTWENETGNESVIWRSSNDKILKVDTNGKVSAVGRGTAKITATVDGMNISDSCVITVKYTWWQWIIIILLFGWIWY